MVKPAEMGLEGFLFGAGTNLSTSMREARYIARLAKVKRLEEL